jgi:hypothetical protein
MKAKAQVDLGPSGIRIDPSPEMLARMEEERQLAAIAGKAQVTVADLARLLLIVLKRLEAIEERLEG